MQRFLRDIGHNRDLPLALKTASERSKANSTETYRRAVETLKESIDYLGPVRIRDVEEAQQRIVWDLYAGLKIKARLSSAGEGGDEIIV